MHSVIFFSFDSLYFLVLAHTVRVSLTVHTLIYYNVHTHIHPSMHTYMQLNVESPRGGMGDNTPSSNEIRLRQCQCQRHYALVSMGRDAWSLCKGSVLQVLVRAMVKRLLCS
jgi:hypothetical protein